MSGLKDDWKTFKASLARAETGTFLQRLVAKTKQGGLTFLIALVVSLVLFFMFGMEY